MGKIITFLENILNYLCTITADGLLGFLGALVGVFGTFFVVRYQIKKEREIAKENDRPILKSTNSTGYIDFDDEQTKSIELNIVNAGETPALDIHVEVRTFYKNYFLKVKEELSIDKIFDRKYDVLMGGDLLKIPIVVNNFEKMRKNSEGCSIFIDQLNSTLEQNNNMTFFLKITFTNRDGKSTEEKAIFNLKWSNLKFTDESRTILSYVNFVLEAGWGKVPEGFDRLNYKKIH
ncbi:hypothetical protein Hs30E_01790 [Lactococcus hodotermopsidis]|uniref:Uncharacterized protein n=1 Tax=Pseudolactococcus hodotermopsidis TaxID=2709157 RepID=A0A6A0BAY7_9LACT|nr:hypothetical protein [Lactococcus hodotermopsidis]GFH41628.1 hypothetical protein Hs30E_01790 [Lactococcus hodotermopsidis]